MSNKTKNYQTKTTNEHFQRKKSEFAFLSRNRVIIRNFAYVNINKIQ